MLDAKTIRTLRETARLPNVLGREARAVLRVYGLEAEAHMSPKKCERAPLEPGFLVIRDPFFVARMWIERAKAYVRRLLLAALRVLVICFALSAPVAWAIVFLR